MNDQLNPHQIQSGSNRKVWWVGEEQQEWQVAVDSRNKLAYADRKPGFPHLCFLVFAHKGRKPYRGAIYFHI
jgi:hypothetical protein